jgi:hypothetical protein
MIKMSRRAGAFGGPHSFADAARWYRFAIGDAGP